MRTRIKICGITRLEDAMSAIRMGADAIGFVFYAPSPRAITPIAAQAIIKKIPPFISKVGLFVNASEAEVAETIALSGIDMLQFHGDEEESFCKQFQQPYYKAVRVKPDSNLIQYAFDYSSATALLLDTYSEHTVGGTGKSFDWALVPDKMPKPVILAGGLNPENVANAIVQVKPYAVDVSGGVEFSKGIKSEQKMAAFMQQVVQADCILGLRK